MQIRLVASLTLFSFSSATVGIIPMKSAAASDLQSMGLDSPSSSSFNHEEKGAIQALPVSDRTPSAQTATTTPLVERNPLPSVDSTAVPNLNSVPQPLSSTLPITQDKQDKQDKNEKDLKKEPSNQSFYEGEVEQIPHSPSAPPLLRRKDPVDNPHCERLFIYQGKVIECDSHLGNDADRLKPIVQNVPAALAEIEHYQENRKKMRLVAYLGTVSLLAMIAGFLISSPMVDRDNGTIRPGGFVFLGGLGVGINSMLLGFSISNTNEAHIGNAVQYYNAANPDRPIVLKFSTSIGF